MQLSHYTQHVRGGANLLLNEMQAAIDAIMRGECADDDIGQFLLALRNKGETVEEIAGAALAMRRHMTPIRTRRQGLVDTCGTGGDAARTFNISTAAALVTAAAGVPVAKHGNRRITSSTGSADVLAALGVNIEAEVATVERCLDELGICFCFAPQLHPAMKHVAAVRRALGVPTVFNLLGPLSNPASAPFQLLGVGKPELRTRLSQALGLLGVQRAAVVTGRDGLDEVTSADVTDVTVVETGSMADIQWSPEDFGIPRAAPQSLIAESAEASAAVIRRILEGQAGPPRDIVLANAAAALWVAGHASDLRAAAARVSDAIDSGAAQDLLRRLAQATRS
jgi:anthranilate phosphoribosyltransferase